MDVFLSMLRAVATNPNFQSSMMTVFTQLAGQLVAHADNPQKITEIAQKVADAAPLIVGAVVKATPMEQHVDPSLIRQVDHATQASS